MADYDRIARYYRLLYADWEQSTARQSTAIGALGLASLGYLMECSDPSGREVAELKREARKRRLALSARVCGFADLQRVCKTKFAAVISCDNSIPHILTPEGLSDAARQMHGLLENNGVLLITTRDYDSILLEKPSSTGIVRHDTRHGVRTTFQLWTWDANIPVYDFELFLLLRKGRRWKTLCLSGRYRAYTRAELTDAFQGAGFSRSEWLMPEETGYFQPVMIAHKGG